jgi:hypothetical protein
VSSGVVATCVLSRSDDPIAEAGVDIEGEWLLPQQAPYRHPKLLAADVGAAVPITARPRHAVLHTATRYVTSTVAHKPLH